MTTVSVMVSVMVSTLDSGSSSPKVQALTGDIVFCSWARYLTLTVPLSAKVNKWYRQI